MVRPHLEYACEVWSPHQEYLKDLIEAIQRRATMRQMIKILKSQNLFKCLHGQCDLNVPNYVDEVKSPYDLRNSELSYKPHFARTNALIKVLLFPSNRRSMECFTFIYTTVELD